MKAQFSHVHWGRVLLTGVLVAILVAILTTVLFLLAIYVWGDQAPIAFQVTFWGHSILALLLTVGGGVWVARKVEREAPLHGLLVGLVAALILFLFSVFQVRFYLVPLETYVLILMVVAGWLGGVLGSRGREKS